MSNDDLLFADGRCGKVIPSTKTHWGSLNKCCCLKPACHELSKAFRKINDIRGSAVQFPTFKVDSTKKELNAEKEHKQRRWQKHLVLDSAYIASLKDERIRSGPQPSDTRGSKKKPARVRAWVALHHFHPALLRNKDILPVKPNGHLGTLKDKVLVSVVRDSKILSCYSDADNLPRDKKYYTVVPNFTISRAQMDLRDAEKNFNLLEGIKRKEVEVKRSQVLARRVSDVLDEPATKRQRTEAQLPPESSTPSKEQMVAHYTSMLEQNDKERDEERKAPPCTDGCTIEEDDIYKLGDEWTIECTMKGRFGGLNRLQLTSDAYYAKKANTHLANQWFKLGTWSETKLYIEAFFGLTHSGESGSDCLRNKLSEFEECLMALLCMNQLFSHDLVARMFGTYKTKVSDVLKKWMPLWNEIGLILGILPFIDGWMIDELEPEKYVNLGLRKVGAVLDGKDYLTETARINRTVSVGQQSNKSHHAAFRNLTWSLPMGLVFEFTCPFLGRASEKSLVKLWGKHGRLTNVPKGYAVLLDKGFDKISGWMPNYNTVLHPAFLTKGKFNPEQIRYNLSICQNRYTCEVVYARVAQIENLQGVLKREKFEWFETLMNWGHGHANLYLPLQMPLRHKEYFDKDK